MPLDLLEEHLEGRLVLRLKDGRILRAKLSGYDQYMNLVLEDTREATEGDERPIGTIILRGNNVVSLAFDDGA